MQHLEKNNKDIDLLYALSILTETRMNKAMTKTTSLKNMAAKFFKEQGYVMSNNRNVDYGEDRSQDDTEKKEKFRGAYVADPMLLDNAGINVLGIPSNRIFEKVCDLDLSSLYPSIMLTFNVDTYTQHGKLVIDRGDGVDVSDAFTDSVHTRNHVAIGRDWFSLPSVEEMIQIVRCTTTTTGGDQK